MIPTAERNAWDERRNVLIVCAFAGIGVVTAGIAVLKWFKGEK